MVIAAGVGKFCRATRSRAVVVALFLADSFLSRLQRLVDYHSQLDSSTEVSRQQILDVMTESGSPTGCA
jgi:hypothetical protein